VRRAAEHSTPKPAGYFETRNDDVLEMLPEQAQRFLEIGCGGGFLGEELKRRRPQAVIHGVDRDPHALEEAAKRLDRVFEADLDGPLPAVEPPYDCIVCADILEHLVDPWTVLRRLVPLLAADGSLIASIPNVRHYKVLRDLVLRDRFTYRESGVLDATHLRFFTLAEIRGLFASTGLDLVDARPVIRGGNSAIRALDRLLLGRLVPFRAVQWVVRGRPQGAPRT
jgi:2-polyprenyl-3-methyl-5-hydroxy-6-metoxy-1,4-benzoquinol methylase